jgi:hypothetical protein
LVGSTVFRFRSIRVEIFHGSMEICESTVRHIEIVRLVNVLVMLSICNALAIPRGRAMYHSMGPNIDSCFYWA